MINAIASEFFGSEGPIVNPQWQAPQPVIDESAAKRIATALGWEPKRTWVGLTDEDKASCVQATAKRGSTYELMAAIEAKLKEKNA